MWVVFVRQSGLIKQRKDFCDLAKFACAFAWDAISLPLAKISNKNEITKLTVAFLINFKSLLIATSRSRTIYLSECF